MCPRHGRTGHIECHHIPLALDYMESAYVWSQNSLALHTKRLWTMLNRLGRIHIGNPGSDIPNIYFCLKISLARG